jgi:hypothetical protein
VKIVFLLKKSSQWQTTFGTTDVVVNIEYMASSSYKRSKLGTIENKSGAHRGKRSTNNYFGIV